MKYTTRLSWYGLLLFCLIAFALGVFPESVLARQIVKRQGSTWIGLKTGETFRTRGHEITEESDSAGDTRRAYIRRPTDKQRILFYTHHRAIEVTLGNKGRLLLINDNEASKANRVVVVDLNTRRMTEIHTQAIEVYKRQALPDNRLVIVPEAVAFSSDDKQVLILMKLIHISVATKHEASQAAGTYKRCFYVVDSISGKVLREYQTDSLPRKWRAR